MVVIFKIFLTLVNLEGEWEGYLTQRRVTLHSMTRPISCSSRTPKFGEYSPYYCFVDLDYDRRKGNNLQ